MPPKFRKEAENMNGHVKWFDVTKGSGMVNCRDFGDVFVHHSRIVHPVNQKGDNFLKASQNVTFDIISGPKGKQASNVKVISSKPNKRDSSVASKDRQRLAMKDSIVTQARENEMLAPDMSKLTIIERDLRGEVTNFDCAHHHGMITIRQYGNVVCHSNNVSFSGLTTADPYLKPTQIVKCDVGRDTKGMLFAINIQVICEATPSSSSVPHTSVDKDETASNASSFSDRPENSGKNEEGKLGIFANNVLGEVTMYDPSKKFGFIHVQGHDRIHVRSDALMRGTVLKRNQIVRCDLCRGKKSLIALNVRVIAGTKETEPERGRNTSQRQEDRNNFNRINSQKPIAPPAMASAPPLMNPSHPYVPHSMNPSHPYVPPSLNPSHSYVPPSMNPNQPYAPPSMNPNQPYAPPYMNPSQSYAPPLMNPSYPYPSQHIATPMHGKNSPQFSQHMPSPTPCIADAPPPYQETVAADIQKLKLSDSVTSKKGSKMKSNIEKKKKISETTSEKVRDNTKKNPAIINQLICEICQDQLEDPVTVPCEHLFCRECINEWLAYNPSCPVDGKAISKKSVKPAPLKT